MTYEEIIAEHEKNFGWIPREVSVRLANVIGRTQYRSLDSFKADFLAGKLHPENKVRGFGWAAHAEMIRLFGAEPPSPDHIKRCPHCGHKLRKS